MQGDSSFVHDLLAVRRERVTSGIPGCRSAGVKVLGDKALAARWTLGTGGVLGIAINLGRDSVAMAQPAGTVIFQCPRDATDAGGLDGFSAMAWIEAEGAPA